MSRREALEVIAWRRAKKLFSVSQTEGDDQLSGNSPEDSFVDNRFIKARCELQFAIWDELGLSPLPVGDLALGGRHGKVAWIHQGRRGEGFGV